MPKADLLNKFLRNWKGFDAHCNKVKFLKASNGNCLASLKVEESDTNPMGTLHGGFSATLVDVISSLALFTHPNGEKPSVSVNMNLTYLKSAKVGDEILIDAVTHKAGKKMAFLGVEIRNKETNELLVTGQHTKFLLGGSS